MRGSPHEEMKETVVANQGHVGSPADNLTKENGFLKNELRSANNEMLLLLQRAKTAERECSSVQQELTAVQMREAKLLTVVKEEEQVVLRLQTELCATKEQVTSLQEMMSNLQAESRLEIARDREHHTEVIRVLEEQLSKKELQLQDLGNIHNQQVADLQQKYAYSYCYLYGFIIQLALPPNPS
ncbi:unnamed protein product, partial [Timema podura]|nr:unnamed protein product [Timema podura]